MLTPNHKMKTVPALIFILIMFFGCATNRKLSNGSFFEGMLLNNLQETPFTAHVKITRIEKNKDIYSDSGEVGYVIFKVYADVVEVFKGDKHDRIKYFIFQEVPSDGPRIGEEFIVSLHYSEEKEEYYIPDNGYHLPVTETLKNSARSKSR
jgi:hypothetical protein